MGTTVFERNAPSEALVQRSLRDSRHSVFWLEDLPPQPDRPALRGSDAAADLVVVGGGYAGLWTAVLAKRRDPARTVILLEARTIGWAASGRNGGFCEYSLTHGEENGRNRWPDEFDELERLGRENLQGFQTDLEDLGIDAEWERTGQLALATEPHQVAWLREYADGAQAAGLDVRFLDETAVQASVHSPTYLAGAWDVDGCAMVHPAKLAAGLAKAAEDLGVVIHEHSHVQDLRDEPGGVRVVTADGSVRATHVALATNVFPSLLKRNRLMTVPVYDYVLMTEPLTDAQLAAIGWADRQGLADSANQFHYYRRTSDGRILFGGYDAVYHPGGRIRASYEERPETYQRLASHFFTTFPQLEDVRFSNRWAGVIDTSTRFCAFHGIARGGRVAYAAGFTGLGVGATRFAAEVMLDRLAGVETERTAPEMVRKRGLPFPPEPAASIGVALMQRSLDQADHNDGKRNLFLRTMDAVGLGFDS